MKKLTKIAAIATVGVTSIAAVTGCFNDKKGDNPTEEKEVTSSCTLDELYDLILSFSHENTLLSKYNFSIEYKKISDAKTFATTLLGKTDVSSLTSPKINFDAKVIDQSISKISNNFSYDGEYLYLNDGSKKKISANYVGEDNPLDKLLVQINEWGIDTKLNISKFVLNLKNANIITDGNKITKGDTTTYVYHYEFEDSVVKYEFTTKNNQVIGMSLFSDYKDGSYQYFTVSKDDTINVEIPNDYEENFTQTITMNDFKNILDSMPEENKTMTSFDLSYNQTSDTQSMSEKITIKNSNESILNINANFAIDNHYNITSYVNNGRCYIKDGKYSFEIIDPNDNDLPHEYQMACKDAKEIYSMGNIHTMLDNFFNQEDFMTKSGTMTKSNNITNYQFDITYTLTHGSHSEQEHRTFDITFKDNKFVYLKSSVILNDDNSLLVAEIKEHKNPSIEFDTNVPVYTKDTKDNLIKDLNKITNKELNNYIAHEFGDVQDSDNTIMHVDKNIKFDGKNVSISFINQEGKNVVITKFNNEYFKTVDDINEEINPNEIEELERQSSFNINNIITSISKNIVNIESIYKTEQNNITTFYVSALGDNGTDPDPHPTIGYFVMSIKDNKIISFLNGLKTIADNKEDQRYDEQIEYIPSNVEIKDPRI